MKKIIPIVLILLLMLMSCRHSKNTSVALSKVGSDSVLVDSTLLKSAEKDTLPIWAERLNEIPLPDYMQMDSPIDVYFKYNQIVNGYEVTARWRPYDKTAETGMVIMNFHHRKTGKDYRYYGKKYCSHDTYEVTFAEGFKGYQNGEIHYFNYTSPDTIDHVKKINGGSPLGYYTPFQCLDIDFDGSKELLVSDWSQDKGGNNYEVYKLTNNGLKRENCIPLDRLTNLDKIDIKKKTITSVCIDGVFEEVEFYFSAKERKNKILHIPEFLSEIAQNFPFEEYNNELHSSFVLDSIRECVKADKVGHASYKVIGNRMSK